MALEKKFVKESIRNLDIEEFLSNKFNRADYSHSEIQRTPLSIRITVYAHRPGLIIGRGGRNIDSIINILKTRFGFENPHQVPKVEKVVVNVGVGEAPKDQKLLDSIVEELSIITGQRPVINRARKSISNFSLREGMIVGVSVTLRKQRMYDFLDRLVTSSMSVWIS